MPLEIELDVSNRLHRKHTHKTKQPSQHISSFGIACLSCVELTLIISVKKFQFNKITINDRLHRKY